MRCQTDSRDYEPSIAAITKNLEDRVESDNGICIPLYVKEKIFNPFLTTKRQAKAPGFIIVKQHGGIIKVETEPGRFTEIRTILPRSPAST